MIDLAYLQDLIHAATPGDRLLEGQTIYTLNDQGSNRFSMTIHGGFVQQATRFDKSFVRTSPEELNATAAYYLAVSPSVVQEMIDEIAQLREQVATLGRDAQKRASEESTDVEDTSNDSTEPRL